MRRLALALLLAGCSGTGDELPTVELPLVAHGPVEALEELARLVPDPDEQWGERGGFGWQARSEVLADGTVLVWSDHPTAALDLPAVGAGARELVLRAWTGSEAADREATVRLNGVEVGRIALGAEPAEHRIDTPAAVWGRGANRLEIDVGLAGLFKRADGLWRGFALASVEYGAEARVRRLEDGALALDPRAGVRVAVSGGPQSRIRVVGRGEAAGRLEWRLLRSEPRTGVVEGLGEPALVMASSGGRVDAHVPLGGDPRPALLELVWRDAEEPFRIERVSLLEPEADRRPSIVVISVDTLAARHTSLHGYARPTTPRLDELAARSTVFERCSANAPWTAPSYMAALTGIYSSAFRMDVTGGTEGAGSPFLHRLPDARWTMAEALRSRGYRTAGFVDAVLLDGRFGFAQGFERYDVSAGENDIRDPDGGIRHVAARALAWLDGLEDEEPFFLFLHAYDVHGPYLPDEEYRGTFEDEAEGRRLPAGALTHSFGAIPEYIARGPHPEGAIPETLAVDPIVAAYDEEILALDAELGTFVDALEARGLLSSSVVIVTADHGESTDDHDYFGHGLLYDEVLHVPFVVRMPDGIGRRTSRSVQLVDLYPTVLELAGVRDADAWTHGRSLVPLLEGEDLPPAATFAEGGVMRQAAIELDGWKLIETEPSEEALPQTMLTHPRVDAEWLAERAAPLDGPLNFERLLAIVRASGDEMGFLTALRAKLGGPHVELYDLRRDPHELSNLAAEHPDKVAELRLHLDAARARREGARQEAGDTRVRLSAGDLAELAKLGYVDIGD